MVENNNDVVEAPKWDLALASLIRDECQRKGGSLNIENFSQLAREHAIRFDDIMETVFALCIHGQWRYTDAKGNARPISQEEVNRLYVDRRLYEKDLREYNGDWSPLNA